MEVPTLGSFKVYPVLSISMEPKINVDDVVIIAKTDAAKLKPGDIITFTAYETDAVITHRIVDIESTVNGYVFTTKGDRNNVEDSFFTPQDRLIGKYVMRIPKLAVFIRTCTEKPVYIVALVFIILLIQFLCGVFEKKLKPAQDETVTVTPDVMFSQTAAEQQQNADWWQTGP